MRDVAGSDRAQLDPAAARRHHLQQATAGAHDLARDLRRGQAGEQRVGVALRTAGQDDCHTYRIPGLATTNAGTLIAVYDNRYRGSGDLPG